MAGEEEAVDFYPFSERSFSYRPRSVKLILYYTGIFELSLPPQKTPWKSSNRGWGTFQCSIQQQYQQLQMEMEMRQSSTFYLFNLFLYLYPAPPPIGSGWSQQNEHKTRISINKQYIPNIYLVGGNISHICMGLTKGWCVVCNCVMKESFYSVWKFWSCSGRTV